VTVGVVEVGVVDTVLTSQEETLSGTGARVYAAHGGWLGVVTGISAASTEGILVSIQIIMYLTAARLYAFSTRPYVTIQYNTIQYNTIQYTGALGVRRLQVHWRVT